MSTTATTQGKVKCSSIHVAYMTGTGSWRGFVQPYDITTEMSSKEEAMEALQEMCDLYQDMLNEHDNPEHLKIKTLSNASDQLVFNKVAARLMNGVVIDEENLYAEAIHA